MKQTRRMALSLALILAAVVVVRADEVDDFLKGQLQARHVPGIAVAVIKDGSLIKSEGYGLADIEHNIPVRPDTVFKIGSVSKQFIATGVMLLVQDRKVALDDKISKYLEGTPAAWSSITVRHLLTHTSGLIREAPGFDPYKVQADMDVIKTAYPLALLFKPGDKWEYSNLGYFVLAEIIRKVSGMPWSDFLTQRVFAPLEMTATRVTTMAELIPNRADGYEWNADKFRNTANWPAVRPSGAFLSTALDMAKWEAALLTDRILTASSKKEMWTPVVLNDGRKYAYGFGWELNDWPANSPVPTGVPMIRHEGSLPGFRAGYFRWPSYGLAVVVLTNLTDTGIEAVGAGVAVRVVPELKDVSPPSQAAPSPR